MKGGVVRFVHDVFQAHGFTLEFPGRGKIKEPADDVPAPFHRDHDVGGYVLAFYVFLRKLIGQVVYPHLDDLEGVLDLMGYARGQATDGFHLFRFNRGALNFLQVKQCALKCLLVRRQFCINLAQVLLVPVPLHGVTYDAGKEAPGLDQSLREIILCPIPDGAQGNIVIIELR